MVHCGFALLFDLSSVALTCLILQISCKLEEISDAESGK